MYRGETIFEDDEFVFYQNLETGVVTKVRKERDKELENAITEEEYEIYSVLLKERFLKNCQRKLCIYEFTSDDNSFLKNGFNEPHSMIVKIKPKSIPGIDYILFSSEDSKKVFNEDNDDWNYFRDTYKMEEIINLSRVSFSSDRKEVILYYDYSADYLAGAGFSARLKKNKDKWILVQHECLWES